MNLIQKATRILMGMPDLRAGLSGAGTTAKGSQVSSRSAASAADPLCDLASGERGPLPPFSLFCMPRRGFTEPAVRGGRSIFRLATSLMRTKRSLTHVVRSVNLAAHQNSEEA